MRRCTTYLFAFFLLSIIKLSAQTDSLNIDLFIENYLEENISEEENEGLYELIEDLLNNPLDLNEIECSELTSIPGIDIHAANNIINYRTKNRRFYSTKELFLVDSLDATTVRNILPFLTVRNKQVSEQAKSIFENIKVYNRTRYYEKTDPGENSNYLGSNMKFYERVLLSEKKGNLSFLVEKDPGESNMNDFLSFSLEVSLSKNIPKIIAGDYSVEFGQGLVIWRPYSFLKGSNVITPFNRKARHLIANKSANEINLFRGGGIQLNYSSFSFDLFYSDNFRDASLTEEGFVTSISQTGYHRTENEINKKHNLEEKVFGGIVSYSSDNLSVEFLTYFLSYSHNIKSDNPNKLNGNNFSYNSISYQYTHSNFSITGELAYNNKSVASINNFLFCLSRETKTILSIRSYPQNFSTMYGNAIGEKSGNQNETAVYAGLSHNTSLGNITGYIDIFNFPFTSNEFPFSTSGKEFLLYFSSKNIDDFRIQLKYKYEEKEIYSSTVSELFTKLQHKLRVVLHYQPAKQLYLKTGIDVTVGKFDYTRQSEKGYLFYEDFKYIMSKKFSINSRICYFKSDSYNSRIYMYENDLRGVFTNLPFYYEGFKWYLLITYQPFEWLNMSLKYSNHYDANYEYEYNNNILYGKNISRLSFQIDNYFE